MALDQTLSVGHQVRRPTRRPLEPLPVGARVTATCRIVAIAGRGGESVVSLVTLGPGRAGSRALGPDTPLTLRFASGAMADAGTDAGAVAAAWARASTPVHVVAHRLPHGFRCRLVHGRQALGTVPPPDDERPPEG